MDQGDTHDLSRLQADASGLAPLDTVAGTLLGGPGCSRAFNTGNEATLETSNTGNEPGVTFCQAVQVLAALETSLWDAESPTDHDVQIQNLSYNFKSSCSIGNGLLSLFFSLHSILSLSSKNRGCRCSPSGSPPHQDKLFRIPIILNSL